MVPTAIENQAGALLGVFPLIAMVFGERRLKLRLNKIKEKTETLQLELKKRVRQQQVIYNISTSIFLLEDPEKIINSTLSEVVTMYGWPNISYLRMGPGKDEWVVYGKKPLHEPRDVLGLIERGDGVSAAPGAEGKIYIGIFPVGHKRELLGSLYAMNTNKLPEEEVLFFKTIASFLTVAIENSKAVSKE